MNIHQITLFLEEVELNQIANDPITNNLDKILKDVQILIF